MSNDSTSKRRLPKRVRETIEFALAHAKRENCCVEDEAQLAMRVYLETWVVTPLENVLRWDDRLGAYLSWGRRP